jgi:hypothetical protein
MTKKMLMTRYRVLWVVVGVLGMTALMSVAGAFSGSANNVVENIEHAVFGAGAAVESFPGESLGGTLNSEPTSLTAADEWQATNSLYNYGDLEVDGTSYLEGAVGAASSTPHGQLAVGAGGDVTSTLSMGKFCMLAGQEDGTDVYVILAVDQANGAPFATTTVSCF